MYREDNLHPGFTKHVLDITLKDGTLCRTATHHFFAVEPIDAPAHSHPFDIESDVREGSYEEIIYHPVDGDYWWKEVFLRRKGDKVFIPAATIHKLIALPDGECITQAIQGEPYREIEFWHFDPDKEIPAMSH